MAATYRTESGDLADKEGNPMRARRGRGSERIDALPVSLTAEQVLKAVFAYAVGLLRLNKERQASLCKLGEAYRLWGGIMGPQAGLEPATSGLGNRCSVH